MVHSPVVFESISDVRSWVISERSGGRTVGFVPTMGALHRGHITLVEFAQQHCDRVVVSIFVNPTQFNNFRDLQMYPRTLEKDLTMLAAVGCDVLFHPSVAEMYPENEKRHWDFGWLSSAFEGQFRPGHFDGVLTIVQKLFEAVPANKAFFGEKDYQQLALIRRLVSELSLPVQIFGCPLIREESGLAMSSRNARLSVAGLEKAAIISKTLFALAELQYKMLPPRLEEYGLSMLRSAGGVETEYLAVVDGDTLEPLKDWNAATTAVILVAAWVEGVRLLDNIKLNSQ